MAAGRYNALTNARLWVNYFKQLNFFSLAQVSPQYTTLLLASSDIGNGAIA